ncbi:MAG TPA: hypothetical protein VF444_18600 [Pseudonocardiaceae bacterium]
MVVRDVLLVLNLVFSVVSAAFCVAAVARPAALLPAGHRDSDVTSSRFYAWFYATRQFPLSVAVIVAILAMSARPALAILLTVAGVAQVGDAAIGLRHRNLGMAAGATVAAVVHIGTAWWWLS